METSGSDPELRVGGTSTSWMSEAGRGREEESTTRQKQGEKGTRCRALRRRLEHGVGERNVNILREGRSMTKAWVRLKGNTCLNHSKYLVPWYSYPSHYLEYQECDSQDTSGKQFFVQRMILWEERSILRDLLRGLLHQRRWREWFLKRRGLLFWNVLFGSRMKNDAFLFGISIQIDF